MPDIKTAVEEGRLHLVCVSILGHVAWVIREIPRGEKPQNYVDAWRGFVVTLPGEHSYWRDFADALFACDRHGLTTVAGSSTLRLEGGV